MAQNAAGIATKYFFVDFLGGIILFPVWWYTRGLAMMTKWFLGSVKTGSQWFGLSVWVKNLFVPMYGETTIQGRLISFFMRLVVIIGKSIAVGVWACIAFIAYAAYLLALPLAIIGLIFHLGGSLIVF